MQISQQAPLLLIWGLFHSLKFYCLSVYVADQFICLSYSYAWVLQDILGISFCISLIRNIRLPNLKVCTILLVLLLIYDIFFVFITPLFSAGKSVMVEVATGKGIIICAFGPQTVTSFLLNVTITEIFLMSDG